MGIKSLWQVIEKRASAAIEEDGLARIVGMHAYVDTPVFAYASLRVLGNDAAVAENLMALASKLHRAGALSCRLVFDGEPHALKAEELARRRRLRERAECATKASESLGSGMMVTDADPCPNVATIKPSASTYQAIRDAAGASSMFPAEFLSIVEAEADAEATCAAMAAAQGGCVLTSDSDALTFGAPHVLRYIPGAHGMFKFVTLAEVLRLLQLDFEAFQQFCVLCGSDFCEPIKNLGPVTALKYICAQGGRAAGGRDLIGEILERRRALMDLKMCDPSAAAFSERYAAALSVFVEAKQI